MDKRKNGRLKYKIQAKHINRNLHLISDYSDQEQPYF
jgi:hypothetical protein